MAKVFSGQAHLPGSRPRTDRAAGAARHGRRRRTTSRTGSAIRSRCWSRTSSCGWSTFAIVSLQQRAAAQSGRHRQHGADARVQHDLELHDEHEPAALQRRDRAVVLLADVRDQLPAVRDRGDRRRGGRRDHPRAWQGTA